MLKKSASDVVRLRQVWFEVRGKEPDDQGLRFEVGGLRLF
jgi:hypothetical protein